ncbi:MAG: ABC transporter ATP-binding protein [Candidatus Eisenbacteria bacterium]
MSALRGVRFDVKDEEFVCLVGPSGCGKTTLLKIVAGLLEPTAGEIVFRRGREEGHPLNALAFQEHGVFPWMTVIDNVAFGLEMQGAPRRERTDRARAFLSAFGLASFARSYPHELSVGMRQRVGIARAFLADPYMLLMDEPFGSLDAMTKLVLQEELLRIWETHKKLVLYVTHDIEEAVLLADRVLVMTGRPGRIREEIVVPLARPRDMRDRDRAEILRIKKHVWAILEEEVRKSIGGAS